MLAQPPCQAAPILEMRKWRHRKVKWISQGHTADKCQVPESRFELRSVRLQKPIMWAKYLKAGLGPPVPDLPLLPAPFLMTPTGQDGTV